MSGDDDNSAEDQWGELLPAIASDQKVLDQILNRLSMVQILASLIARSPGSGSGSINDPSRSIGLPPAEAMRLRAMGFEAGGFRTIRTHVRAWESGEVRGLDVIAANMTVYPPGIMAVLGSI